VLGEYRKPLTFDVCMPRNIKFLTRVRFVVLAAYDLSFLAVESGLLIFLQIRQKKIPICRTTRTQGGRYSMVTLRVGRCNRRHKSRDRSSSRS
jgi:hypothetical protein